MLSFIFSLSLSSSCVIAGRTIGNIALFSNATSQQRQHYHRERILGHPLRARVSDVSPPFHSLFIASRFGNQARVTLNPRKVELT